MKEGARGRRDGKLMEGDNEPLHVVVTGDNQDNVDKAAQMVTDMLIVIDDDKNIHKQAQLRELALLNGTLKEDEYCSLCAEKGHRAFECPKRFSMNKPGLEVKCAICGDTSHPTRDCKQKDVATAGKDTKQLDSDYLAFMNELEGKPANAESTEKGPPLQSLVTSIGPDGKVIGGAPLCQPIVTHIEKKDPPSALKPSSGSLITTISSRVVKTSAEPAVVSIPAIDAGNVAAPPLPAAPLPPSLQTPTMGFPPPPIPGALPPPMQQATSYYGQSQPPLPQQQQYNQYQQQQSQHGYGGYQNGGQGYQQGYQGQGYQNQNQGQGYQNQAGGNQAGGWNYGNYYGNNNNGNNNNGSQDGAGFNWWDSNNE